MLACGGYSLVVILLARLGYIRDNDTWYTSIPDPPIMFPGKVYEPFASNGYDLIGSYTNYRDDYGTSWGGIPSWNKITIEAVLKDISVRIIEYPQGYAGPFSVSNGNIVTFVGPYTESSFSLGKGSIATIVDGIKHPDNNTQYYYKHGLFGIKFKPKCWCGR